MWTTLKTKAITALTISAIALGAGAPAHAMDDQTRNLIKGAAAVLIIGTLLSGMSDDRPTPQPRYAPPPAPPQPQRFTQPQRFEQPQRFAEPPRPQHMAPPPRAGRLVGGGDAPPRDYAPRDYAQRDYAQRDDAPRGYDVPRLNQPPRQQPMR